MPESSQSEASQQQPPTSFLTKGEHLARPATQGEREHAGKGAADRLRAAILEGELRPGAKLSEQVLGDSLGVSRNTLREVFAVLSAERIITKIPNRGVFVANPTHADVQEMYRVRLLLEPAALTQEGRPAEMETALAAAVQQGLSAAQSADVAGMAAANQLFHALVVGLVGSSRLNSLMAVIQADMRLVFHTIADESAFHRPFSTQNAHIFSLWQAGDGVGAAAEMTHYLEASQSQLRSAMPD